jgi:hypothetical protein
VKNIPEGNLFDLPISEGFMAFGPLSKTSSCIYLFFSPSDPGDEDMDNCMLFFHQPFLISVVSWLTSWGSLETQTQVPP